jgi:hypothetical protein
MIPPRLHVCTPNSFNRGSTPPEFNNVLLVWPRAWHQLTMRLLLRLFRPSRCRSVLRHNPKAALALCFWIGLFSAPVFGGDSPASGQWIKLFNGKDLKDWKIKIKGFDPGVNYLNTFRVENGVLRVVYDEYDKFDGRFGHIFYKDKFSHYRLRAEYRFVGKQTAGGPGWAFRNSGLMLHCQAPESMRKDQEFPVSIEVQLLGGDGVSKRSTANLCTPGTHVVMDGRLITQHCTDSRSKTYHGDQWVTVEVEVHGNGLIRHFVNGELVMEYERPQLDESDADAKALIKDGNKMLSEGYIALQAESHPVEFRNVELMVLEP